MFHRTRAERRPRPLDHSTTMRTPECLRFLLDEAEILERFRKALVPKPKKIKRRERL
jgi:hypothetical protein